jgi:predicted metal-dependent hydrolase
MIELTFVIVILTVVLILFLYYEKQYAELTKVKSAIDNKEYLVRNKPDKQAGADLLARVVKNIDLLLEYNKKNGVFNTLEKKYNPDNISESLSNSKYTSYSLNKGEKIVLCIRHKNEKEDLVDLNTLMFVVLHELAHLESKSVGHNKEFWDNMNELLKNGIKIGIYKYVNYKHNPIKYCGINVTATPLKLD